MTTPTGRQFLVRMALLSFSIVPHLFAQKSQAPVLRVATVKILPMPEDVSYPGLFVGSTNALAFVDFKDTSLYRGDAVGKWSTPWKKTGGGPGEIRTYGGMHFAKDGTLWINDRGNSRLTSRATDETAKTEITPAVTIGRFVPTTLGFIAVPNDVSKMALVLGHDAKLVRDLPLPPDIAALHPMTRERYIARVNDSLTVIQFRWLNRRIAITNDGRTSYDSITPTEPPSLLQRKFDGGTATYVDPKARPYAVNIASRGDTLLILLGSTEDAQNGRKIVRVYGPTGRTIDTLQLPVAISEIAATRTGVFGLGETDSGFVMYQIAWK